MIRERIAIVPEERVQTTYRLWHCIDCGLQFSMLTRERPKLCPRCLATYLDQPSVENLIIELARGTYDKFVMGGLEPQEAHNMIREILKEHEVLP